MSLGRWKTNASGGAGAAQAPTPAQFIRGCPYCGQQFPRDDTYNRHLQEAHRVY